MAVIQHRSPGHGSAEFSCCLSDCVFPHCYLSHKEDRLGMRRGDRKLASVTAGPSLPHHSTLLLTPPGYIQDKDTGYVLRE